MRVSYVVLNGGLGNQLWQLAFAHKLARSKPVKVVQIAKKEEKDSHLYNGARIISQIISSCSHQISFDKFDFASPFVRSKFLPESQWSKILPRKKVDSRSLDWKQFQEIDLSGNVVHLGFYQSITYLRKQVPIVLEEFQALLSSQANIINDENKKSYAIIHLRGGDYYQERHKNTFGVLDRDYYLKIADEVLKYGFLKAYVVTDDYERAVERLSGIDKLELEYLGSVNEIATMRVMSSAKIVGIANSSFSWWGGMLSKNNGGIMIAPYPWFKRQREIGGYSDLYESDIARIQSSFLE